jgi:hypothetical protein
VFAFSSLWFTHYVLAALQALRAEVPVSAVPPRAAAGPVVDVEPKTESVVHESANPILPAP